MFAFIGSLVVVGLLLWAGYSTMSRRRGLESMYEPTRAEHAAADAGRVGAFGTTGEPGATGVGAPTYLDDQGHGLHDPGLPSDDA
ncbi:MAG: hypothetical protein JWM98_908 [Thermoleophilia bacterium]|nr:hypothetical protein [Thermoleophilia bacterium]